MNFYDHNFRYLQLVLYMRYLQTVFCFGLFGSQAIISDQNGRISSWIFAFFGKRKQCKIQYFFCSQNFLLDFSISGGLGPKLKCIYH